MAHLYQFLFILCCFHGSMLSKIFFEGHYTLRYAFNLSTLASGKPAKSAGAFSRRDIAFLVLNSNQTQPLMTPPFLSLFLKTFFMRSVSILDFSVQHSNSLLMFCWLIYRDFVINQQLSVDLATN